jgi:phosphate transport system protein
MDALRMGLVEMASVVLSQVERSVVAWEEHDPGAAAEVIAGDEIVDDRCLQLDQEIFGIHIKHAPVAGDLRLMHVGLIAAIALERVGDLAVSIARLAGSVPHEGAVASVQSLIQRMSARAVDTLAQAVQAIARGDIALGEQARDDAQGVQAMLDQVIVAAAQGPDSPETRTWQAAAVLVARHLERVANNAAELGGRVRFLVAGEPFRRARDLEPVSESTG